MQDASPCCQSIHQKSTPSSSRGFKRHLKYVSTKSLLHISKGISRPDAGSSPMRTAASTYCSSWGCMPSAGWRLRAHFKLREWSWLRKFFGSRNSSLFHVYPVQPLPCLAVISVICQSMSMTATLNGTRSARNLSMRFRYSSSE